MTKVDVSVVLNMHREALFLAPTLYSLQHCAREAMEAGIVVELIAVFDRSDESTREVFRSCDLSIFHRVEEVEVDVGSLGLARNAGIERARGEFIWTSDADDLVSSNCIVGLLEAARQHPHPKVAIFVEYLCAFGEQYHNVRYVDSQHLAAADFAFQHPYVSRIFIHRAAFSLVKYGDLRVTSGFAYEDWHLNCELRALGYDMKVARETIFFYRQRPGSLLRQANAASARLIPHGRLFDMDTFLADMRECRERAGDWDQFMRNRRMIFDENNTETLMRSEKLQRFLWDAVRLEPEIEPNRVETAGSYSPMPWNPRHWGVQMESLYRMIGEGGFTDVVLLPWLNPGGAEKYILQVLAEIANHQSEARLLVITGEAALRHDWVGRLPNSSVFIDIYNAFPSLDSAERDAMLVRAMLAVSDDGARLHVKSSAFAHRLLDAYAPVLFAKYRPIYYRFSDGTYPWKGEVLRGPWGINVMRRHLNGFWKVLTDCRAIVEADRPFLGTLQSKYQTIYAQCASEANGRVRAEPKRRLLWASRVAPEKRPELVKEIVRATRASGVDVMVDVFGTPDEGMEPRALFDGNSADVVYRGKFSSFSELPVESYDAFLYTSAFDGLPNVLLEALSAGLPVIAPNVGGIGEAVVNEVTGRLIEADDDTLVARYAQAICSLYEDWPKTQEMSANAMRLIAERHGVDAFSGRVGEVLDLIQPVADKVA